MRQFVFLPLLSLLLACFNSPAPANAIEEVESAPLRQPAVTPMPKQANEAEGVQPPWFNRRAVDQILKHLTQDPAYDEPVPDWWEAQLALSYGAWWVTRPKVEKPGNVYFTKRFTLDEPPALASLTVATDGTFTVSLNGHTLPIDEGPRHRLYALRFDVAEYLKKGDNELIVHAKNKEGGIEMLAMLFMPPHGGFVSDGSWHAALKPEDEGVPVAKTKLHAIGTGRERMLGWNVLYKKVTPVGVEIHPPGAVKYPLRMLDVDGLSAQFPSGETKRPVRVIIDFGREVLGYIHIVGHAKNPEGGPDNGPVHLKIATGEFYEEAKAEKRHRLNWRNSCQLPIGTFDWRYSERSGFRYLSIDIPPTDTPFQIDAIYLEYPYYPVQYKGSFLSSDPMLNRIWAVSAYTLRICMQSFYEDGVKRDTWPWMGDARVEALFNYPLFGDTYLARFTMDNLRGRGKPTRHFSDIPAYSAYWVLALNDYYEQTGDKKWVADQADEIASLLDFCLQDLDADGLYDPPRQWWRFIDWTQKRILFDVVDFDDANDFDKNLKWTEHQIDYRGAMTAQHALLYEAVMRGVDLLRLAGREKDAKRFEKIGASMKEAGNRLLWDPARGAYADARVKGALSEKLTRQSNAVAILSGMAPKERHPSILKNVFLNDDVPQLQTYYFSYYTLETRYRLGDDTRSLDRIRKHWGPLIARGATTLWERYDPERRMGYGEMFDTNMSHGWGAAPLELFPKYILGVKRVAPGWAAVRVEPNLHDLQWAQGTIATPKGNIVVRIKRGPDGKVVGTVQLPKGIRLEGPTPLRVEYKK